MRLQIYEMVVMPPCSRIRNLACRHGTRFVKHEVITGALEAPARSVIPLLIRVEPPSTKALLCAAQHVRDCGPTCVANYCLLHELHMLQKAEFLFLSNLTSMVLLHKLSTFFRLEPTTIQTHGIWNSQCDYVCLYPAGAVLPVWKELTDVVLNKEAAKGRSKPRVLRAVLEGGCKITGAC